ncbi:MAG: right-handed parallel beta-helix repeat-containing protein [Deltaproteobacteria bacterium]|nr:right-handed parallel beta-helix repeat-containing protein [Deltaproteobacteria bacterium]
MPLQREPIIVVVALLGLCGLPSLALGGTQYYVSTSGDDTYDGLSPTYQHGLNGPWQTMEHAASAVPAGDNTINVEAGTYALSSRLVDSRSGNGVGSERTWKANGPVVITGNRVLLSGDHIEFDGFEISGLDGAPDWTGALGVQGDSIIVVDCTVHDVTYIGISAYGSDGVVDHCTIYDNIQAAIMVNGSHNAILNNDVSRQRGSYRGHYLNDANAFQFSGDNHVFRGNYIHDIYLSDMEENKTVVIPHFDVWQTCCDNAAQDTLIEKNHSFIGDPAANELTYAPETIEDPGIRFATFMIEGTPGRPARNLTIQNNIFEGVLGYCTGGDGYVENVYLYNNVFRGTLAAPSQYPAWPRGVIANNHNGIWVWNNVFVDFKFRCLDAVNSTNVNMDYNLCTMSDGSTPVGGPPYWRSGTGTAGGSDLTNNLAPHFKSYHNSGGGTNDFGLLEISPLRDNGNTIASIVDDYVGTARPQNSLYDIGAYEFIVPPPDAGSTDAAATDAARPDAASTDAAAGDAALPDAASTDAAAGDAARPDAASTDAAAGDAALPDAASTDAGSTADARTTSTTSPGAVGEGCSCALDGSHRVPAAALALLALFLLGRLIAPITKIEPAGGVAPAGAPDEPERRGKPVTGPRRQSTGSTMMTSAISATRSPPRAS